MTLKLLLKISPLLALLILVGCESRLEAKIKTPSGCRQKDQEIAINAENKKFPKEMDKCASDAWGKAYETSTCLKKKYPGLSDACSNCYGALAECTKDNCKFKCMSNHFGDACLACIDKHCRAKLLTCTGLEENKLPPKN